MTDRIDRFAHKHSKRLLEKLAREVKRAAKNPDEEAIHDLRVALRRLSQSLEEFHQFFPRRALKKTLGRLGKLRDLAAGVRNRDIAIALLGEPDSALTLALAGEREKARKKMARVLAHWRHPDI